MTPIKFVKVFLLWSAMLLLNGADASTVGELDDSMDNHEAIQPSSALRAGIQRASFWPQSPLQDNLRNLKKNKKVEKLFDPVEDAIKDLDKKEEKKLKKKLKKVIKELSKKNPKEDKVEKAIEKFLKELNKLQKKGKITGDEYDGILELFNVAIGDEGGSGGGGSTTATCPCASILEPLKTSTIDACCDDLIPGSQNERFLVFTSSGIYFLDKFISEGVAECGIFRGTDAEASSDAEIAACQDIVSSACSNAGVPADTECTR